MDSMKEEIADVVGLGNNNTAKVELVRTSACGECTACSADKKIIVTARNNIGAKVGDRVNIKIKGIKKTALFFVYIMPIILLFIGFYIGKIVFREEILSVLTSIALPAIYVIVAIIVEKSKKNINCDIVKIIN